MCCCCCCCFTTEQALVRKKKEGSTFLQIKEKKTTQVVMFCWLIINILLFPILMWMLKHSLEGIRFWGICVGNVNSNASKITYWKVELLFLPAVENKRHFAKVMRMGEVLTKCHESGSSFIFLSFGGGLFVCFLYIHLSFTPSEGTPMRESSS